MKDCSIEFYVKKFSYIKSFDEADIGFIPAILRRRLSKLDKGLLHVLNNVFDDDIQNIIFSSDNGEVERLLKIIEQYKSDNAVSPNVFSGSVHNYPVGFFLQFKNREIPYTALSSCGQSLSYGLLSSLITENDNIIFCYSDIKDDDVISLAINITKKEKTSFKCLLKLINSDSKDNFNKFVEFFSENIDFIKTGSCELRKI